MSSESQWFEVERQLANRWDYVNPIGAIDGKHVVMIKPRSSRSTAYFNYKQLFSIKLMAIVWAYLKFIAYSALQGEWQIWEFGTGRKCDHYSILLHTATL